LVINVSTGRTSIENRVSNRQNRVADGGAIVNATALVDGRVAAQSAVDDRERLRVPDAAAVALVGAAGGVATKSAVSHRHRPVRIVDDAAAYVGRVAAKSAVNDRERRVAEAGGAAIVDRASPIGGRVAADCAVAQRQGAVPVHDAGAEAGRIAAKSAVSDRHRFAARAQPVVRDAAAVIGRVAAQSAARHYQRSLVVKDAAADAFAPGAVNG